MRRRVIGQGVETCRRRVLELAVGGVVLSLNGDMNGREQDVHCELIGEAIDDLIAEVKAMSSVGGAVA